MITPEIKRQIKRILPFGIIWFISGVVYVLLEKSLLHNLTHYPATGNPYNFGFNTIVMLTTVVVFGLIVGTLEVLYLDHLFIKQPFIIKIVSKTFIYVVLACTLLILTAAIQASIQYDIDLMDERVGENIWMFFGSWAFWIAMLYIAVTLGSSFFYAEVSEYLGLNVVYNFFLGRYHQPVEEERIFMFLDMRSSTSIAEELGHIKYFKMLRRYYSDLSRSIIKFSGEIYQYVGDEVVVSWTLKKGLPNNNCLKCFFDMKKEMQQNNDRYLKLYGVQPGFKAGFHIGKVTTGEIGVIKKDIIFTGDVLNTTARIQSLCNVYKVDVLLSEQLQTRLKPDKPILIQPLGETILRGRREKIKLFTVRSE